MVQFIQFGGLKPRWLTIEAQLVMPQLNLFRAKKANDYANAALEELGQLF